MDRDTCIIYIGRVFTVEWYFNRKGKSPGLKYFLKLTDGQRQKFYEMVIKIAEEGHLRNKTQFRYEGDGIYAFKPVPDRYLSFFTDDKKIIVTNGFVKKKNKLPIEEKKRALRLKQDYINRKREGKYYGNDV